MSGHTHTHTHTHTHDIHTTTTITLAVRMRTDVSTHNIPTKDNYYDYFTTHSCKTGVVDILSSIIHIYSIMAILLLQLHSRVSIFKTEVK